MTARFLAHRRQIFEALIIAILAGAAFAVHDVGYMLSHPFWVDETWVAITVKAPLHLLRQQTSVVPIGWAGLLRLPWPGGEQRLRELPLCFDALTAVVTYLWARSLLWPRRSVALIAGALAGVAALLAPTMLIRSDLKQFTADACLCVVVLSTTTWLELSWSRRRLTALVLVAVIGMLFSAAAGFAAVACFGALFVVSAARRNWPRTIEVAVAGAVAAIGLFVVYRIFYASHVTSGFYDYWAPWFPPANPSDVVAYLHTRLHQLAPVIGLGPAWLAGLLALAGLIVIGRRGAVATAAAVPVLCLEMLVLGASQRYPLLDVRTSTFLLALLPVLAAIGVAGIAVEAAARLRGPVMLQAAAAVTVAAVAIGFFAWHASNYVRKHTIPSQDVRSQVQTIETYRTANDVVVVSYPANWGFAYYWPVGHPTFVFDKVSATQYVATYPADSRVIVVRGRDFASINSAVQQARALIAPGSNARIWIVRTDVDVSTEAENWGRALQGLNVRVLDVGDEPLLEVTF